MDRGVAEAFSAIPEGGAAASAAEEKVKVVVAIDDSDESYYALKWVLENLVGPDGDGYLLTIIHVTESFPHYMLLGSPGNYIKKKKKLFKVQIFMILFVNFMEMLFYIAAVYPSTSIIQSVNKAQQENAAAIINRAIDLCSQREVSI